jgi:hypothetical protein
MDETPVWLNMAGNFTVDQKGNKLFRFAALAMTKFYSDFDVPWVGQFF